ncbi:hypothetical protein [Methyloglobulus sp.]|uniref:hypothetical protein n=1 Tax=Methyloglobulus sp. TaxID=2518622 RepID=UPI00398965E9
MNFAIEFAVSGIVQKTTPKDGASAGRAMLLRPASKLTEYAIAIPSYKITKQMGNGLPDAISQAQ